MKNLFLIILGIAVLSGCTSTLKINRYIEISNDDRVTLGGSNSRSNVFDGDIKLPIEKVWEYSGSAGISPNQLLVADSVIFVGFMNGELHAINISTGKKIGKVSVDAAIHGSPVMTKDMIYVPIAHNKYSLKAYNFDEGQLSWKKEIEGIESSLLLIDKSLFAVTENGILLSINSLNGKNIWEYKAPKKVRSSIASDGQKIYFGCDDGYVYAINKTSGKFVWKFYGGGAISGTPSIDDEGNIYIGSSQGYFYSIRADSGYMNWKFDSGSDINSGSAVDKDMVYFGNSEGNFYALNKKNGIINWDFKAGSIINSSPTVTNRHVLLSSYDRKVYILEKNSAKKIWDAEFEGRVKTTPIVWRNFLIICSEDYDITLYKY